MRDGGIRHPLFFRPLQGDMFQKVEGYREARILQGTGTLQGDVLLQLLLSPWSAQQRGKNPGEQPCRELLFRDGGQRGFRHSLPDRDLHAEFRERSASCSVVLRSIWSLPSPDNHPLHRILVRLQGGRTASSPPSGFLRHLDIYMKILPSNALRPHTSSVSTEAQGWFLRYNFGLFGIGLTFVVIVCKSYFVGMHS